MNVLLAFDKFKDSMTAKTACVAAARALAEARPGWSVAGTPLTDGGEGFCEILTEAAGGAFRTLRVCGPRFRERDALLGLVSLDRVPAAARALLDVPAEGTLAVIEMAQAAGLELLRPEERDPHHTSTYGVGQCLDYARQQGAAAILLGIGGSATSDLGLGALEALGLHFHDPAGRPLTRLTPAAWPALAPFSGGFSPASLPALPPIRIACDVRNPLLGPQGAAAVYGPQKGLRAVDLPAFDQAAAGLAAALCRHFGAPTDLPSTPGAGAAGGLGFGLMAACGARLVPGFDLVTAWLELADRIAAADLILTGEGSFDESSLAGKGPFAILEMARAAGAKPVHLFAGRLGLAGLERLRREIPGFQATAIARPDLPLAENLRLGPQLLAASIRQCYPSA